MQRYGRSRSKEQGIGSNHPQIAVLLYQLARLYQAQGKYEQAKQYYQRTLAIDEQAYGLDDLEVATDLETYAGLLVAMEQGEEAERLLGRARDIRARSDASKGEGNVGNVAEG